MKLPIYLDYCSTTPVEQKVADKMYQYLTFNGIFGNPASRFHPYGWKAAEAVDVARNYVASLIGANPDEIFFTSGATESNNLALKGVISNSQHRHIITSLTEHKAILDVCQQLEQNGCNITRLTPQKNGIITLQQVNNAICKDTVLISLMHVNNETGIIQNIDQLGQLCRDRGIIFHVDATQSVGKIPIDLNKLPVDLMSFSSHKLYGPKGIGGIFIRNKPWVCIQAQIHGGGHERGMRAGTLPVHQIVGMGEAYRIAAKNLKNEMLRLQILRNLLWKGIKHIEGIVLNTDLEHSVGMLLNVSFHDVDNKLLIMELRNLAVSTGSACNSANTQSSHVLKAMGLNDELANNSIRFSLGKFTTSEEIEFTITYIQKIITRLRRIS